MRFGRHLLTLALLGTVIAVPAIAQSQPGATSTYPECTGKPSADDSEAARNAYLFGKRKYDEAEYATAVNYFKDAYKTDCTKHEILIIISRSYELAGNKAEAITALETYLKRVPNAPDAAVQRKRIENLKAQGAPPATTTPPTPTTTATSTATAAPTTTPTATTTARPPGTSTPPSESSGSVGPWILAGTGVVVLGTGVLLVVVGAGNVSSANDALTKDGCDLNNPSKKCTSGTPADVASQNDKLTSGTRTETIGGVLIGVGAVAVVGGLVWHFAFDKPKAGEKAGASLLPVVSPGYAGVGLGGTF
jgi:tetratricopeptide (TPR) repeat protein